MTSDQNEGFMRNDIVHALAFAAYLYSRIADEMHDSSLAASRYAMEIAGARTTIAAELASSRHSRLAVDYDDTPNATEDDLINQSWAVDTAIITTLNEADASDYKSITDGMFVSQNRLIRMLNDITAEDSAWQCCVCQRVLEEKQEECPCGASSAALRPVWKDNNGHWYGVC